MTDFTPAQKRLIEQHRDINTSHDWWDGCYESFISRCRSFGIEISHKTRTFDRKGPDGKFLRGPDGKVVKGSYEEPELYFDLYRGSGVYFAVDDFTIPGLIGQGRLTMLLPADHDDAWMKDSDDAVVKELRRFFEALERTYGVHLLSAEMRAVLDECTIHPKLERERMSVEIDFDSCSDGDATEAQQKLADELTDEDSETMFNDFFRDLANAFQRELEDECEHLSSDDQVWEALEANDMTDDIDEDEEESCNA